jgi:hypothetical protein
MCNRHGFKLVVVVQEVRVVENICSSKQCRRSGKRKDKFTLFAISNFRVSAREFTRGIIELLSMIPI